MILGIVPAACAVVRCLPLRWVSYGEFRRGWVDPFASVRVVPSRRFGEFRVLLVRERRP